jgi:hypothetical protein
LTLTIKRFLILNTNFFKTTLDINSHDRKHVWKDCKLSIMPKNSFLQAPTSLPSICGENNTKQRGRKRGKKHNSNVANPGVSYGGVASFPSRSQHRGIYIRTPTFIVLWVGGFNMRVGKCLQFFMRWGREHAHAIVTFGCLCKQAI